MFHKGVDVDEFAHLLSDGLVEIDQKFVSLLEEGTDVVRIIVEERTLTIGTLQRVPVHPSPLVMVANAKVFDQLRIEI